MTNNPLSVLLLTAFFDVQLLLVCAQFLNLWVHNSCEMLQNIHLCVKLIEPNQLNIK